MVSLISKHMGICLKFNHAIGIEIANVLAYLEIV